MSIEYEYLQLGDGNWWYRRTVQEEDNPDNKSVIMFGPYPTDQMAVQQMEYARRHEDLNSGGGLNQNINAPTERAMINDIFGWGNLGIAAFQPRR